MLTPSFRSAHALFFFLRHSLLLFLAVLSLSGPLAAQADKETQQLQLGQPIKRALAGGQQHTYSITLTAGAFFHVVVDQRGIDVLIRFIDPDGRERAVIDRWNDTQGLEPFSIVAAQTGRYQLIIEPLSSAAAPGHYIITLTELRRATAQDRARVRAEMTALNSYMAAQKLRREESIESLHKAVAKYKESLPFWRAAQDELGVTSTLTYIGESLALLEQKQQAINYYMQALPRWRALKGKGGEAETLHNIAVNYYELGETSKALAFYDQALPAWRAAEDRVGEAATLSSIGRVYDTLGQLQQALDYYSRALPLARAAGDRFWEGHIIHNIGMAYNSLGEQQRSLEYFHEALELSQQMHDPDNEAHLLHHIGEVYLSLGDTQQALKFLNQALPISHANEDLIDEATTLNHLGGVYYLLADYQRALAYYNQALQIRRTAGYHIGTAETLRHIGATYLALGQDEKSFAYLREALALSRSIGERRGEAETLSDMARVYRARGQLAEAVSQVAAAIEIAESLRHNLISPELRTSYFATVQDYYALYIDLLMQQHRQQPTSAYAAEALRTSERAHARSLLETLNEANANIRQGVDAGLLARERSLQQLLDAKAQIQVKLLSSPQTEAQGRALAHDLDSLTAELQAVEAQIRQTSPRYAALTQPQPLTPQEIQTQVLDSDTVLLEYALGPERSYLWAVTPTAITSYELPKRAEIETVARAFYTFLHTPPQQAASNAATKREIGGELQQQARAQGAQAAAQLSRMLLAPVAASLGKKRLLIVADGALQYIPFAALPVPERAANTAAAPSLIIEHEIVSLPSASTLAVLRHEAGEHKAATKTLAVLADPVFERMDERLKPNAGQAQVNAATPATPMNEARGLGLGVVLSAQESGVAAADLRIPRLLATRREADAISALAPPAARLEALDFAANRAAATDPALADYRFVHFATHGLLDSQHPELSGLLLSMFDEQGRAQDGFLRAHEVFNLKLNADVVVLSACQTGLGKEVKGEGLVGLTRGFMYAGVPRVVVSLWSVNDAATAELMTRFYRGMLVEKLRPAQALQAAQVSMLRDKRFSAPFYWAAFTLQGEWR